MITIRLPLLTIIFYACAVTLAAARLPAAEPARSGKADWALPPYITLSQRDAAYVKSLPVLGAIEWTLQEAAVIPKGPEAGISGAAFVRHDDALYLCGGFIPAGDETTEPSRRTSRWAHRYDPQTDTWQKLPDMPGRKEYTRGIAHESGVYVVGGLCQKSTAAGFSAALTEVYRLTDAGDGVQWRIHSRLNVARTHPSAEAVGDYLVVVGGNEYRYDRANDILGMHPTTMRDTVEVFDVAAPTAGWRIGKPIPGGPRGWAGSAVVGKRMYLFAGLKIVTTAAGKQARLKIGETVSYDPEADAWAKHANAPFLISGWEADVFRDRYVLLVGGIEAAAVGPERMGQNTWNDIVFAYDTVEDRWLRLEGTTLPGGVYNDPGVTVVGDTIYVVGGEGPRGSHFNHFLVGKIRLRDAGK